MPVGDLAGLDENLATAWRLMTSARPGHPPVDDGEVLLASTGAPVDFFNPCVVRQRTADPERALARIDAHYHRLDVPYLVWLRDGLDPDFVVVARSAGLDVRPGPPAMAMSPIAAAPPLPAGLVVDGVGSEGDADAVAGLSAAANGISVEMAREVVSVELSAHIDAAVFIGRLDGLAVSTSTLVISGSDAGVYGVATEPRCRRRGFGQALTWAALAEGAARGCHGSVLQTSEVGRSIYERMGFRVVGDYLHIAGPGPT
jgi:ribosomal protein S18 acetylase RimI-like enzyme